MKLNKTQQRHCHVLIPEARTAGPMCPDRVSAFHPAVAVPAQTLRGKAKHMIARPGQMQRSPKRPATTPKHEARSLCDSFCVTFYPYQWRRFTLAIFL